MNLLCMFCQDTFRFAVLLRTSRGPMKCEIPLDDPPVMDDEQVVFRDEKCISVPHYTYPDRLLYALPGFFFSQISDSDTLCSSRFGESIRCCCST